MAVSKTGWNQLYCDVADKLLQAEKESFEKMYYIFLYIP